MIRLVYELSKLAANFKEKENLYPTHAQIPKEFWENMIDEYKKCGIEKSKEDKRLIGLKIEIGQELKVWAEIKS